MTIIFQDILNVLKNNDIHCDTNFSPDEIINNISSLKNADSNEITFFDNQKYIALLESTNAKACFINNNFKDFLPSSCHPIIVSDPYICFAHSTNLFNPDIKSNGKINKNTSIDQTAIIKKNVQINANSVIEENTFIDENVIIYSNCVIGPNVNIGKNTVIYPNNTISNTSLGNNCIIQSGCVVGDSGFGFTISDKIEIKHSGDVVIGNNVQIGSNTTIDRASIDSTIIANNVRIDNLVQIAHSVFIGNNTIIAAQVGIAGSAYVGKNCIIGGQVGISGHLTIGNYVTIAGKSGVTKNIKDESIVAGFPAIDIKKWKKNIINLNKINK